MVNKDVYTEPIYVKCYCHNTCYLPYVRSLMSSSSFSKTVPQRTGARP